MRSGAGRGHGQHSLDRTQGPPSAQLGGAEHRLFQNDLCKPVRGPHGEPRAPRPGSSELGPWSGARRRSHKPSRTSRLCSSCQLLPPYPLKRSGGLNQHPREGSSKPELTPWGQGAEASRRGPGHAGSQEQQEASRARAWRALHLRQPLPVPPRLTVLVWTTTRAPSCRKKTSLP